MEINGIEIGYIKLYRKFIDWEWFFNDNILRLFIYLLLKVNNKNKPWQGIDVKRGQIVTSYNKLATALHLTERQINYAIKRLKLSGELSVTTTNKYSILTLLNYEDYQDYDYKNVAQNVSQDVNELSVQCKTNVKQMSTTKEYKNIKKEIFLSEDGKKFSLFFKSLLPAKRKVTKRDMDIWAEVYDILIKRGETKKDIADVCKWARQDEFWGTNFYSAKKLITKDKTGTEYFLIFNEKMKTAKQKLINPTNVIPLRKGVDFNSEENQKLLRGDYD